MQDTRTQTADEFAADMGRAAETFGQDFTPVLEAGRKVLLDKVDAVFDSRSTPDGEAWPPRKDNKPHPLLEETGALRAAATGKGAGAINELIEGHLLVVGVDPSASDEGGVPWAGLHNFGGKKCPQREFMGVTEETADTLAEQAAEIGLAMLMGTTT